MNVRPAQADDLEHCITLSRVPEFTFVYKRTDEEVRNYLNEFLEHGIFLVAEENGEIIGCLFAEYMLGRHAWIDGIVVREDYRGKGIGKQLVAKFRTIAIRNGVKHIYLMAPTSNQRTVTFYESCGMEKGQQFVEFLEDL